MRTRPQGSSWATRSSTRPSTLTSSPRDSQPAPHSSSPPWHPPTSHLPSGSKRSWRAVPPFPSQPTCPRHQGLRRKERRTSSSTSESRCGRCLSSLWIRWSVRIPVAGLDTACWSRCGVRDRTRWMGNTRVRSLRGSSTGRARGGTRMRRGRRSSRASSSSRSLKS